MSIENRISYEVLQGKKIPSNSSYPMTVVVAPDSMGYGTITFRVPFSISSVNCEIYKVYAPSTADIRWFRDYSVSNNMIQYSYNTNSITWQVCPATIDAQVDDFYSIEFFINTSNTATVGQTVAKFLLKIEEYIV